MRQSLSIMAATTAVVAVAAGSGSNSNSQYDSMESQQQQHQHRVLDGWYGAPSWGLEPESSGKSGKGSGKSGKSSTDDDDDWSSGWEHGHGPWGPPPPPPPHPPGWWSAEHEHSESGKSGKSKSSKGSGDDGGSWVLVPPSGGWEGVDGWSVPESDSGKSGKGSSGKSGKGEEEEEEDDDDGAWEGSSSWSGPWGPPPPHPPFESTGKSGKSKSSKGSSDEEGWFGPWGPGPWGPPPPESEGKSGKAKSGKSGDGEWVLVPPPPSGWNDDDGWSGPEEDSSSGKSGKSGSGSGSSKSGKGEVPEPEPSTWSPPPKVEEVEVEEEHTALNAICFEKGERVDCSAWGGDGHGDGEGAVSVAFTYTVDTDGEVDPESTIGSMENAILEDVAAHVEENDKYASFSGKISAAPGDGISDDDWCGDGHAVRCSVVKGEMSVSPSWSGDGHAGALDACAACKIVEDSMEGQDYTDIDGVTGAKYRNCDAECESGTVIAGAATVVPPQDEDLSGGALFAIWLAALAAIALLALLLARKRRSKAQEVNDDMSLISNDLDGNHFGDYEDPYANTIDVHKCTSIYCNCNSKLNETTFLPAPKSVDMARTRSDNGLAPSGAAVNQLSNEEEEPVRDDSANEVEHKGSIMRMPFAYQSEETTDRPLTPVNEIAHDSEIDTELESVADDDTNIPPPPPIAFHPSYNKQSSDEISI